MRRILSGTSSFLFAIALLVAGSSELQSLPPSHQVVVVPFDQANPSRPHMGHEQAPISLKAIIRNAISGNPYDIRWDIDQDGILTDETPRRVTANGYGMVESNSEIFNLDPMTKGISHGFLNEPRGIERVPADPLTPAP